MYKLILLLLLPLLPGCGDRPPPSTPETRPVDDPNAGNTDLYDVDPEDPYEIGNGEFLDLRPGGRIADHRELLSPVTLRDGEADLAAYRITGRRKEDLGYVLPDPADTTRIGTVTVTSPDVVTGHGIRIGYSYEELVARVGAVATGGSDMTSRVYARRDGLAYRLEMSATDPKLAPDRIDPSVRITEITIE